MNSFSLKIENLQHIKELEFLIDVSNSGLMVIVGKNGVGKTMLFKAIQNLVTSNTFATTSNTHIYQENSKISYTVNEGEFEYQFTYNDKVQTLDFKGEVNENITKNIFVELPIPFGERFKQFQKLGSIDKMIRSSIISHSYTTPSELIKVMNYIYNSEKFNALVEINLGKDSCYSILLDDSYYIREDYLSSGEYFIVNIFKYIKSGKKLIAIDEIDISLDSMAQVRFVKVLRDLSLKYGFKLLFSTHSLALIKTLQKEELYYMDLKDGIATFENKSYNYIKSLLYGFHDYDKYILTEDEVLKDYMEYLLEGENIFSKYIILPIGGASNTIELMNVNSQNEIFDVKENVCSILDADMSSKKAYQTASIYFSPFDDIEDMVLECFKEDLFGVFNNEDLKNSKKYNIQRSPSHKDYSKSIYKMLLKYKLKSKKEIFDIISNTKREEVDMFKQKLIRFLNK